MRVLIVEDDDAVADMLELTFALEGLDVERIADGAAALARLDGPPADLVVLDLMMPEVDGYRLLEELRRRPEWAEVPVIIASALSDDEHVWKGWRTGADYYLSKPFDLDHLRRIALKLVAEGR